MSQRKHDGTKVKDLRVDAYRIPTDAPEADGTLAWNDTTMVCVHLRDDAGREGFGYTYADRAAALLIAEKLKAAVLGEDPARVRAVWHRMHHDIRNLGRPGICASAIAAVDIALWDLLAKTRECAFVDLLGRARDAIPVYGSGGFTSYDAKQLEDQLRDWMDQGIRMVKMKVGTHPDEDGARVGQARSVIGPDVALFVDANGAYDRKQALAMAESFLACGVTWFEEPVSSDDLEGLHLIRDRAPAGMAITAGEYGYDAFYFRRMLAAGAVDVLQADATRCAGVTGFLMADALCQASNVPLSAHTAPALHGHLACVALATRHIEYFHDHVRIENLLFDGVPPLADGRWQPDRSRLGFGISLRDDAAAAFRLPAG